ncbi:MAG: amidohydrolase, partial [Vicinamibacteria bacterium]
MNGHLVAAAALTMISAVALATPTEDPPRIDSDAPWSVEDAHGPTKDVAFTTDEGTWLSLDVHPDGRRLVFSLLGDLYLLPMEGGDARRITSGPGYDVQPRFSPDGAWIAFASDRGGTENLWICDLEGKRARAISSEEDAFVNSPAWTPDGRYLVGRKRLTDTSSLGTVELWMWHVRGGKGVQLTKKDTQPDAADPTFSPDGRFLYFSARDSRFRYDRNVNPGIWQIKRLDRRTGQVLPITGELGGAGAPTVSPDGQTIAFIRRVRARTRIELLDVATGRLRTLASEVQRDNQEGFAFHGVFPGFAWTPDGSSLVATAEGRIWRWDVETGARSPVSFEAAVEQRVSEALRFPQSLGAETVRARILRWPVESPDGRHLVFQAVGHLYVMDLPEGTPRRLTTSSELEYAPAFSSDGTRLTFVTWSDETGGHVWTMPFGSAEAGPPRRLTVVPGQYANPAFSPDGDKVVFVRGSGATFRDHDHADELWHEIHWVDSSGGPSHYVIGTENRGTNRRTTRPQFSGDAERIFYIENDPEAKPLEVPRTHLVSVKLDGTDHRAHLSLGPTEGATLSPDGQWLAFAQDHNVYVTALPMLGGQTVEVDVDDGALPVGQLTDEGGEWVGWADGGRTVTWNVGPTYSRVSLDEAVPVPEPEEKAPAEPEGEQDGKEDEKEDEKTLPETETIEIVLELPRARPEGLVVYAGARIVTMNGDEVIEDGVLVVEDDRIRAVGSSSAVAVPKHARVVDVSNRTIIPGLFDEHAHLHYSTLDIFPERPWKYLANLAYGVTATHDPSASTHEVFGQAEMVEAGLMTGPRIFSTG